MAICKVKVESAAGGVSAVVNCEGTTEGEEFPCQKIIDPRRKEGEDPFSSPHVLRRLSSGLSPGLERTTGTEEVSRPLYCYW